MKKLCVFWSNCQSAGIVHFLKKTRMAEEYEFSLQNNWQHILGEQRFEDLMLDLCKADLVIYQPTTELDCTNGTKIPASDALMWRYPKPGVKRLSFSYVYNNGFFPLLKVAPGVAGWITGSEVHTLCRMKEFGRLRTLYDQSQLRFDCIARFAACIAEQSHREQTCDIKVSQFILEQFQSRRLFLTQNHPTSAIFVELASQILRLVYGHTAWLESKDENEAQMNGTQPIHHSVVRELGLRYPAEPQGLMHYREQLDAMIKEYQAL